MARQIMAANRILITTHARPDGDAIGSTLALARALAAKGKKTDLFLMGPVEPNLMALTAPTAIHLIEREHPKNDYELAILTDTGAWSQVEPLTQWLKSHHDRVIGIDHHTRGDDIASSRLIDPKAVSTTAMIVPLLDEMKCKLTGGEGGVAEALFIGLATDSGWFRYGNAGADTFELAARLLTCGVDKSRLYQILEETYGPQRLTLEAKALASLEFARHGSIAIQSLRAADFASAGASMEDLTGLVNMPMTVATVRVSILLAQNSPQLTKISFRSKPAPPGGKQGDFTDVNELAAKFGGGGHIHAAGARINADLDQAKAMVRAAFQ